MSKQYTCEICGKEEHLRFVCSYCGGSFCSEHHLPENHNCINRPRTPPSYIKVKRETYASKEVLHELEGLKEREKLENHEKYAKIRAVNRKKKIIQYIRNFTLLGLLLVMGYFIIMIDFLPPVITIISPVTQTYSTNDVDLNYLINEPVSWMGYSLNDAERITLTGNTTLIITAGRHNLTVYANDTAGNMGFANVSFTVTNVFKSMNELASYLRMDNLSDAEWTVNYTCDTFAKDFIKIAESKGYYIFTYLALYEDEWEKYCDGLASIRVVKGNTVWSYNVSKLYRKEGRVEGHAVVKTVIGNLDVIVDPQTDIIMTYPDFQVLYEGEMTQD